MEIMGRKIKMNHLNEKECEWILNVIHRDYSLRQREKERLDKIEQELSEAASQRKLFAKEKDFNQKSCILCSAAFNLLFNKKVECNICKFYVCRNCASWENQSKGWLCRVCEQQNLLYFQSCDWFYEHIRSRFSLFGSAKVLDTLRRRQKESAMDSENDSGYGPAFPEGRPAQASIQNLLTERNLDATSDIPSGPQEDTLDPNELPEVRQHIETVVEGLVGENVDGARIDKCHNNSQYLQMFEAHHSSLVNAILNLSQALQSALQNKPNPEEDVTPTTAHAVLKQIILELSSKAAQLPCLKKTDGLQKELKSMDSKDVLDSLLFQSYGNLLATAIINTLVDQSQKLQYGISGRESSHSDLSLSDSGAVNRIPLKDVIVCSSDSESLMDDFEAASVGDGGEPAEHEFSWASDFPVLPQNIEYLIEEEQIEEITQEVSDNEDESDLKETDDDLQNKSPWHRGSYSSGVEALAEEDFIGTPVNLADLDILNSWDLLGNHRVSFPEYGVDIISEEGLDLEIGDRRSSITAWEENWLFRKKKLFQFGSLRHQLMGFYGDPPYLLIPNPQGSRGLAQIDDRDVDQLSDLSEQNSVGSLEFSDSSGSDVEQKQESPELVHLAKTVNKHFSNSVPAPFSTPIHKESSPNNHFSKTCETKPLSFVPANPPLVFVPISKRKPCKDTMFVRAPENLVIHAGKMAHFSCQVQGLTGSLGVAWFYGNHLLENGDKYQINQRSFKNWHALNIYDTVGKDSGAYSCVVYHSDGSQQWCDFALKVKASSRANGPPEFVVPLRVVESSHGQARLSCTLSGYPEPKIVFFHNRKPVDDSEKITLENTGYGEWVLTINNTDSSDEGGYEVVASNRMGHAVSAVTHRLGEVTPQDKLKTKKESRQEDGLVFSGGGNTLLNANFSPLNHSPLVVQRTWLERSEGAKENKMPVNIGNFNVTAPEFSQPVNLSCPPKPGSIAEREHNKWENAPPILNNPYSRKNVEANKRKLERRISDLHETSPVTFEEFSKQRDHEEKQIINTGLRISVEKEYARYKRDYYINNGHRDGNTMSQKESDFSAAVENKKAKVSDATKKLHSLEEKVMARASQLVSLDDHVQNLVEEVATSNNVLELEGRVVEAIAHVESCNRDVTGVVSEVEELHRSRDFQRKNSTGQILECHTGKEKVLLPSVKKLANLFAPSVSLETPTAHLGITRDASESSSSSNPSPVHPPLEDNLPLLPRYQVDLGLKQSQITPSPESERSHRREEAASPPMMLPVVKRLSQQFNNQAFESGAVVQRVHSLTARSLSKEFRQMTQKNLPRPSHRNLSVTSGSQPTSLDTDRSSSPFLPNNASPLTSMEDTKEGFIPRGGYTSDESSATSNTSSLPRQRSKVHAMSKTIHQRASYWERRAEQGLLSDNSVSEDFPSISDRNKDLREN